MATTETNNNAPMAPVTVVNHPLIAHKLSLLRDARTKSKQFRELLDEVGLILAVESSKGLDLIETQQLESPVATYQGVQLKDKIALFPILRAGLGLVDSYLRLIPTARVHHLGLYREKATFLPVEYYNKLPSECTVDMGIVLDPMIATAGTAIAAINILKDWGLKRIQFVGVVASREGLDSLRAAHPDIEIIVAVIDEFLTDNKYIVPGLGDAGDRSTLVRQYDEERVEMAEVIKKSSNKPHMGLPSSLPRRPKKSESVLDMSSGKVKNESAGPAILEAVSKHMQQNTITGLFLTDNNLTSLPAELQLLTDLTILDISYNEITRVSPSLLKSLAPNLRSLSAQVNKIAEIPTEITTCQLLETVSFWNNEIGRVPSGIFTRLGRLKVLDLGCNRIRELSLPDLPDLQTRGEEKEGVSPASLPDTTSTSSTSDASPPSLSATSKTSELEELLLNSNHLTSLSAGIAFLSTLRRLCIHKNRLTTLPIEVSALKSLEELDVSCNEILELPPGVFLGLRSLKELYLQENRLVQVPSLADLESLEVLDVSGNPLTHLPLSLATLGGCTAGSTGTTASATSSPPLTNRKTRKPISTDLEILVDCHDESTLQVPPVTVCRQGAQAIIKYLADVLSETPDPARCEIVGLQPRYLASAEVVTFDIRAMDKLGEPKVQGGDTFHVRIDFLAGVADGDGGDSGFETDTRAESRSVPVDVCFEDNQNGTYTVSFQANQPGLYIVSIQTENGEHIKRSPFQIAVAEIPSSTTPNPPVPTKSNTNQKPTDLAPKYTHPNDDINSSLKAENSRLKAELAEMTQRYSKSVIPPDGVVERTNAGRSSVELSNMSVTPLSAMYPSRLPSLYLFSVTGQDEHVQRRDAIRSLLTMKPWIQPWPFHLLFLQILNCVSKDSKGVTGREKGRALVEDAVRCLKEMVFPGDHHQNQQENVTVLRPFTAEVRGKPSGTTGGDETVARREGDGETLVMSLPTLVYWLSNALHLHRSLRNGGLLEDMGIAEKNSGDGVDGQSGGAVKAGLEDLIQRLYATCLRHVFGEMSSTMVVKAFLKRCDEEEAVKSVLAIENPQSHRYHHFPPSTPSNPEMTSLLSTINGLITSLHQHVIEPDVVRSMVWGGVGRYIDATLLNTFLLKRGLCEGVGAAEVAKENLNWTSKWVDAMLFADSGLGKAGVKVKAVYSMETGAEGTKRERGVPTFAPYSMGCFEILKLDFAKMAGMDDEGKIVSYLGERCGYRGQMHSEQGEGLNGDVSSTFSKVRSNRFDTDTTFPNNTLPSLPSPPTAKKHLYHHIARAVSTLCEGHPLNAAQVMRVVRNACYGKGVESGSGSSFTFLADSGNSLGGSEDHRGNGVRGSVGSSLREFGHGVIAEMRLLGLPPFDERTDPHHHQQQEQQKQKAVGPPFARNPSSESIRSSSSSSLSSSSGGGSSRYGSLDSLSSLVGVNGSATFGGSAVTDGIGGVGGTSSLRMCTWNGGGGKLMDQPLFLDVTEIEKLKLDGM
ncbi:hypothetical protein HK102_007436 [Quaeritorhiza haematococci]|nr:hypothetical protein HK102_007436 [Quaeritorhiza haematococci]